MFMNILSLTEITPQENVAVHSIQESPISEKLIEMGIYKGKIISVRFKAPFGDPVAVEIDGALLSLRLSEAKLIKVIKAS